MIWSGVGYDLLSTIYDKRDDPVLVSTEQKAILKGNRGSLREANRAGTFSTTNVLLSGVTFGCIILRNYLEIYLHLKGLISPK